MGAPRIIIRVDSQVAAGQIDKSFQARHQELAKYLAAFQKVEAHFKGMSVRIILRSKTADADTLAKAAANNKLLPAHVLYEVLHGSAVQDTDPDATSAPVTAITTTSDWRGPIMDILSGRSEGSFGMEVQWLRQKVRGYVPFKGVLYKMGVCALQLRCISREQGAQLLKEIHEGHYGTHLAPRALAGKMLRHGLYWPTIMSDVERLVRLCQGCQWMG
ncbi:hypothetical protein E2562_010521 [Oryza meyeriana var. granulata]|uniref:Integrase zinc-binding domain-containing protein n=1 Tax=Oryza meyeriana var. granulata TaxID=110450 RepID=A0A6G1DVX2_9ORYZ|nr:hypothetical protein E2562_010521 [Oryza meyeriana var. granulata]